MMAAMAKGSVPSYVLKESTQETGDKTGACLANGASYFFCEAEARICHMCGKISKSIAEHKTHRQSDHDPLVCSFVLS